MLCVVREVEAVRERLKLLDDPALRKAYIEERMKIVDEIQTVRHPITLAFVDDTWSNWLCKACDSVRRMGCCNESEPFARVRRCKAGQKESVSSAWNLWFNI